MNREHLLARWNLFIDENVASLPALNRVWACELLATNAKIRRAYALGDLFESLDQRFIEMYALGELPRCSDE